MATPVFPLDRLPYPVRDNFAQSYATPFKKVQMDDGHSRTRRQWASQTLSNSLMWRLDWKKLGIFEGFLKYECGNGPIEFMLAFAPGQDAVKVRLTTYPTISFDAGQWVASAQFERVIDAPSGSLAGGLPSWPLALPMPEKGGYTIEQPNAITRGQLTGGKPQERARQFEQIGMVTMKWFLTADQYPIAVDFVHNTLLGGLSPFKGWFANGKGTQAVRMTFTEAPSFTKEGACFWMEGKVEIRDLPQISELEYTGKNQITIDEKITLVENLAFYIAPVAFTDSLSLGEQLAMSISITVADTMLLSEAIDLLLNENLGIAEGISIAEQLAIDYANAAGSIADSTSMSESGSYQVDDYADDYAEFDYVGTDIAIF